MQLHNGGEPHACVATYRREVAFQSSFSLLEIYQISSQRIKAETLSWPCGWLSPKDDSVHNARQR